MKLINKTMRKLFTIFTLLSISFGFATDRFVDPNLSSGNGTTLFTNITSAVAAAQNGDRIIIASSTYNEAALTIGKSLQIMPQTPGTTISFNANITIAGFPGMKLEISGFNLGIYSINSVVLVNGSINNRAKVSIINCTANYIDFNNDFYKVNIIENSVSKGIIFRFGNVVKNITKQISLLDEPQNNPNSVEKNLIIANQVQYLIGIYNNDYMIVLANNTMRDLSFRRWNANTIIKNYIINNEFTADCVLHFSTANVPYYNIIFSSNKFNSSFRMNQMSSGGTSVTDKNYNADQDYLGFDYDSWMPRWAWCCNGPNGWYYLNGPETPTSMPSFSANNWSTNGSTSYLNTSVQGFFEFSYNGITSNMAIPGAGSPLNFTNIQGSLNDINGGNPNHFFYDIDLTINDRGVNGGPYSLLNYNAANPNNSKAFIFDLDMPTDLFPGQNVEIKAQGYHKN